jgi:protein-tyrosine phosphatase
MNGVESVLVHSVRGQSRASCVVAALMMRKYRWSLLKVVDLLVINRSFVMIKSFSVKALEVGVSKTP